MYPTEIAADGYDLVTYKGLKVSTELLEHFAVNAHEGTLFRFVNREASCGTVVTIERVPMGEA
jgi:hypothetical protein